MNPVNKTLRLVFGCIAMAISMIQLGSAQVETRGETGSQSAQRFQTRAEIAALPRSSAVNPVQAGFAPRSSTGGQASNQNRSVYRAAASREDVYPYPAKDAPRVAIQTGYTLPRNVPNAQLTSQYSVGTNSTISSQRKSTQQTSFTLPAMAGQTGPQLATAYRQPVYQAPTLGLSNPSFRSPQNCNCQSGYKPVVATSLRTAAYQAPSLNSAIGTGVAAPPSNIQTTGGQGYSQLGQPNYQNQSVATPQNGAQGATWWTPFVTGSGSYPPVVRRQNMPVGTYMGQGFVGQPTAYVDGQPVRNLLRYITP